MSHTTSKGDHQRPTVLSPGAVRISFGGYRPSGAASREPTLQPAPVDTQDHDVWLVIAEDSDDDHQGPTAPTNSATTTMRQGAIVALPKENDASDTSPPTTYNDCANSSPCTLVRISGGLNGLRDALNEHLPPTKEEERRTTSSSVVPHRQYPDDWSYDNPPPPASPKGNIYYPQELSEVKRFELFRQVIEHEDDLLNQRVSWIILAQSFLMAAFITSSSEGNKASKVVTAFVGLATVIVTLPAIVAAGKNIEVQQTVYFHGLESDAQCLALHGHSRNLSRQPTKEETSRRLEQGHIFPNTAFRGKHSLPILSTVVALAVVQVAGWILLLLVLVVEEEG